MAATTTKAPIAAIISPTIQAPTLKMLSSTDSSAPLRPAPFAAMTVSHNPNSFQTLPAKKHYFEMSPELVAPGRQLEDLKAEPASEEWERRRHNLHAET